MFPESLPVEDDNVDEDIHVELADQLLWKEFSECGTEMIITKNGR